MVTVWRSQYTRHGDRNQCICCWSTRWLFILAHLSRVSRASLSINSAWSSWKYSLNVFRQRAASYDHNRLVYMSPTAFSFEFNLRIFAQWNRSPEIQYGHATELFIWIVATQNAKFNLTSHTKIHTSSFITHWMFCWFCLWSAPIRLIRRNNCQL